MDPIQPFEWGRIFFGAQPPMYLLEICFKVVGVFVSGLLIMRGAGKRSRKELTSFDVLIVIALGSAVGDVMFYPDIPLIYAVVILSAIVVLSRLVAIVASKFPLAHDVVADNPTLIIQDGHVLTDRVRSTRIAHDELMSMLREHGIANIGEIRRGYLELSGSLGVIRFPEGQQIAGDSTLPEDDPGAGSSDESMPPS